MSSTATESDPDRLGSLGPGGLGQYGRRDLGTARPDIRVAGPMLLGRPVRRVRAVDGAAVCGGKRLTFRACAVLRSLMSRILSFLSRIPSFLRRQVRPRRRRAPIQTGLSCGTDTRSRAWRTTLLVSGRRQCLQVMRLPAGHEVTCPRSRRSRRCRVRLRLGGGR